MPDPPTICLLRKAWVVGGAVLRFRPVQRRNSEMFAAGFRCKPFGNVVTSYAARTWPRKSAADESRSAHCDTSFSAAISSSAEARPVSSVAVRTSMIPSEASIVPVAASLTLLLMLVVADACSSTETAITVALSFTDSITLPIWLISSTA